MVEVDSLPEHDSTILALLVREARQYEVKCRVKVQKGKDVPLLISSYRLAADDTYAYHTLAEATFLVDPYVWGQYWVYWDVPKKPSGATRLERNSVTRGA